MATKFLNNIDLNQNELQKAKIEALATAPSTPVAGQVYYNTVSTTLEVYTGSVWVKLGRLDQITAPTGSVSLNSQLITNLQNPINAQDAATRGYILGLKITDLTAPTSALNMNNQKISSLAPPTLDSDAATKKYVDDLVLGIDAKFSVRCSTTENINLTTGTLLIIDGIQTVAGDRVLVKNQSTASQNGIYVAGTGAWVRSDDMNESSEFVGSYCFVEEGTTYADTGWVCSTDGVVTVGTTAINFVQFSSAGTITASNLGATGSSVFASKVGSDLQFRKIIGTSGIVATQNTNDITLTQDTSYLVTSGFVKKYVFANTGTSGSVTITHNLGNQFPVVTIVDTTTTPKNLVFADITYTTTNELSVAITGTYSVGQYQFTVMG